MYRMDLSQCKYVIQNTIICRLYRPTVVAFHRLKTKHVNEEEECLKTLQLQHEWLYSWCKKEKPQRWHCCLSHWLVVVLTMIVPGQCWSSHVSLYTDGHRDASTADVSQLLWYCHAVAEVKPQASILCKDMTHNPSTTVHSSQFFFLCTIERYHSVERRRRESKLFWINVLHHHMSHLKLAVHTVSVSLTSFFLLAPS